MRPGNALAVALDPVLCAVQTALDKAKGEGSVPLDASTLNVDGASGAAVVALIAAQLGAAPTLEGATQISQVDGQDALLVKGNATGVILGIQTPAVTATFTTVADSKLASGLEIQVTMQIAGGPNWSFATSFPQLSQTGIAQMTLDNATVAPAFVLRSVDGPGDAYGPVERAGLNLEVGVVMDGKGPFGLLGDVLSAVSGTLKMAGPVSIGASAESMAIRAPSGVPTVGFPVSGLAPISLAGSQVMVSGVANFGSGTWSCGVELDVWALVSIGGNSVPLGVGIPVGFGSWRLFVVPDQGVRLFQLLEFIPGLSLLEQVPDQVQNVVNVDVGTFALVLGKGTGGWSVQSLQVIVSSPQAWTIIPGVVEIEQIAVALTASWPVVSGTVGGMIGLDPVDGQPAVDISVTVPVPLSAGPIRISSLPGVQLPGLGALTTLIGGADLTALLPAGMENVGSFVLGSFAVSVDPAAFALQEASISLAADAWTIIPQRLELDDIFINLDVRPAAQTSLTGSIGGTLTIADAGVAVLVERSASAPDWELSVNASDVRLPSLADIGTLAGTDLQTLMPKAIADLSFEIAHLKLDADLSKGAMLLFGIIVQLEGPWVIVKDRFEIDQAMASLTLDWRSGTMVPSGELRAVLDFGDLVYLELDAQRPPSGGWILNGALEQPVDVTELVSLATGIQIDSGLASGIEIDVVSLTYHTLDGSYQFAVAASWKPKLAGGLQLEVDASLALARAPDQVNAGQWVYSGHIEGDLKSHFGSDQLELAIVYGFQPNGNSFVFRLGFNQLTLTATYTTLADGDAVITARLTGVSFGELLEWLVNLVDSSLHFQLSAPWDMLNKIYFDDFAIVGNLTKRTIGVEYDPNLNLGLADVTSVTLTYLHKGGSPTIDIAIVGSFAGQEYPPDKPLTWDLLQDPPPAAPGAGAALIDLQDLGVGQHLVLADQHATTMGQVMADVHAIIVNTTGDKPWDQLKFDPGAGWLVAAGFTVMDTVSLKLIFNDPVMYGVEISLAGQKAGPFAGLDFQILYRKISDDVGVYHTELKLPDAMRHLEFGAVSITLPIVVIDIYTDGGFYLDFGFPYNNGWTVCFGVQVFPFVGVGGFYAGRLSAADGAANLVPAVTNGTFSPVIEFGVALAIGVGKTINEGPLSAGVSITAQGVLQGVVAWFNPADASQPSDRYYKVDGSLALVGKLYGTVDFKIITVSVSVVATVTASVQIEAYAPIMLGLSVDVQVQASIKILGIRIHFSFSMHLDASFTIGSRQATPWQLALGGGAPPGQPRLPAARRLEGAHHLFAAPRALAAIAVAAAPPLDWQPVNVVGARQLLTLTMLPVFTVAPAPAGGEAVVTVAMVPSMDSPPPDTTTTTATSFDALVESLVLWGMQTLTGSASGRLTAVDLQLIYEDLTSGHIAAGGFAYGNVAGFMVENFVVAIAAPPSGTTETPAAVVPMPPPLRMSPDGQPAVDFWTAQPVDAQWQQGVQELFAQLAVDYGYSRAPDPLDGEDPLGPLDPLGDGQAADGTEPLAEALFGDWALMVARGAIQAARDQLSKATETTTATGSLIGLAWLAAAGPPEDGKPGAGHPPPVVYHARAGDTAASIAALFGVTVPELIAANADDFPWSDIPPGTACTIPPPLALAGYVTVPGDTLASIAGAWWTDTASVQAANPGVDFTDLAGGTPVAVPVPAALFDIAAANLGATLSQNALPIAGLTYTVLAGDTLSKIAVADYRQPASAIAALAEANAEAPGVLLAGAADTLTLATAVGTIPYVVAAGDGLELVAAFACVRNRPATPYDADQSWFANAISQANPGIDFSKPLGPSTSLQIPGATATPSGPSPTGQSSTYSAKAGDTLLLVAGYFAMVQLNSSDPQLEAAATGITALNPTIDWTKAGTTIQLPPQQHTIVAGDTLGVLAGRFGLTVADIATLNACAQVLTPNATLTLPPSLSYQVPAGAELADVAATLGLTVDEFAGRVGAVPGVLAADQSVTLPNRRQMDVGELTGQISGAGTANVAGMASHFTLHGLRLPVPPDPANPVDAALYALTGQQFPAPSQPLSGDYAITFSVGDTAGTGWIHPVVPYTTSGSDTLQSLEQAYGAVITTLNPAVDWSTLQAGEVISVPADGVSVEFDQATLAGESPETSFSITSSAEIVPLVSAQSVRHSVAAPVPWAAAAPPVPPVTPGAPSPPPRPAGGGLALWRLPAGLLSSVAASPSTHPYALMTSLKSQPVIDDPAEANYYAWATWLPITIERVPTPDGGWLEGTYAVIGAAQTDRDALFGLWTAATAAGVNLSLAYTAAAGGTGLASDALDTAATAVLKTNLSTETHSGAEAADADTGLGSPPPASAAYAELGAPAQFLQLLWEASVVGTGGFYLAYAKTGGGGLPNSVWASGDQAQLHVMALLDDALAATPDRTLYPFITGAVVADNLDPSKLNVFAEATDSSDETAVATAPPGNIAFQLTRANDSAPSDPNPLQRSLSLFSMLDYVVTGDGFARSPLALPVGPTGDGSVWTYDQTLPVFRLAQPRPADMAPGLPPGADDPYAGIAPGAEVNVALAFRDVFGNQVGTAGATLPSAPVGYYDPVRPLAAWPGISAAYAIGGTAGAPVLDLRAGLSVDKYVPGPGNLFPVAVRTAAAHQATYRQVHYQVQQPDVTFSAATSLDAPCTPHLTGPALETPLRGFVMGTYLYLGTAQDLQQYEHTVASGGERLGAVAGDYTLTPAQLLTANAAADAAQLVDGPLTLPLTQVVVPGDTLDAIATADGVASTAALLGMNDTVALASGAIMVTQAWRYWTGTGDTLDAIATLENTTAPAVAVANTNTPHILDTTKSVSYGGKTEPIGATDTFGTLASKLGATVAQLAAANHDVPLFLTGIAVFIAQAPVPPGDTGGARSHTTAAGDTLAGIAQAQHCTVAGLALANGQAAVLDTTKTVEVNGTTVPIRDGTFATVVADLLAKDTAASIADVGVAIADPPDAANNVLLEKVTLAIPDYVVQPNDTLAGVLETYGSIFDLEQIALLNDPLASGLYPTGTPLVTGSRPLTPLAGDSFATIAADAGLTVDQLGAANAATNLNADQPLVIPGATELGATQQAGYQVPFDTAPMPTLNDIAVAFDTDPAQLGADNATMPGLVAADVTLTYTPTGEQTATRAGDTLASVAGRVGAADAAALVTDPAVNTLAGLVAAGALLQCPLAQVNGRSLSALAQTLGVDPTDLATANSALIGLITPGNTLVVTRQDLVTGTDQTATISTTANDTIASLVRKLQLQVPAMELADLLAAYGGSATLLTSTSVIVPPARVAVSSPLKNPQVGAPFTPLEVTVTIARQPDLADAAATAGGLTDVVSATSALVPDLADYGDLAGFATAIETALAPLRLKLAAGPDPDGAQRRLWMIDFGSDGFAQVAVQGTTPRFYALPPIGRELTSGPVSIKLYDPKTGTLSDDPVTRTFASIHLDTWMRTALEAIDLFLSPVVAAPAFRLNPSAFTTLVQSKGVIAAALRDRVAEILLDPAPDPAGLAAAQQALYESMLTTLSSAYTTDAVVQFPVAVTSPYGPTYTTGSADTFATVAAAYGVSPEAAQAQFADVAPHGTFPPHTTLDQSAMLYTTGTSDTFATLAAFFTTDPGTVAIAALDVPGLVPAGTMVGSYHVQANEKLRDIATGSGVPAATIAADCTVLSPQVQVHCFSPPEPIAPRLVATPSVERYPATSGNTAQQLLAWFSVSATALGEAIEDARGILCAGAVVANTADDSRYTIGAGDTFTSLLQPLGATSVGALLPTLQLVSGAGLLQPGVALALGRVQKTPRGQDSFTTLAAFFDDDPASLAVANQDIASVFVPGTVFTLASNATYTIKGPETIAQVAQALATDPEQFAIDPNVVQQPGVFNTSTPLHGLQPLPDFSLSTAKVPLVNGTQFASFLFGTSADASFRSLFLNLDCGVGELEFQIADVPGAPGYQTSDWLRLGVPLNTPPQPGIDLHVGEVDVPIPLRSYPQLPLMEALDACATWTPPHHPPTTIGEARQWHLSASLQHQSAAQDETLLQVTFNCPTSVSTQDTVVDPLFDKLAQFVTAWPNLQHDVAALAAMTPGTADPGDRLANMTGAFATLITDLAGGFAADAMDASPTDGDDDSQIYTFLLDTTYDFSGQHMETVELTLQPGSTTADIPWPAIWVTWTGADGKPQTRRLTADAAEADRSRRYYYPQNVPAFAALTHRFALPGSAVPENVKDEPRGRDAVRWQAGAVAAAVRRNAELVGGATTATQFVYQTPWISFANPAIPLLRTSAEIDLTSGGSGFQQRLEAGLTTLLTSGGKPLTGTYNVRLLCRYALELAVPSNTGGGDPIVELLPVFYVPLWPLSLGTSLSDFATGAATQLTTWLSDQALTPAVTDAYVLDLSLFASGDVTMTRPLVELSGLRMAVT
ncbi:LysM peptidoglycan-binding domain-containing protein [Streptosporangium sp. NPDC000396]|uniref:LysM peptidoglycan-binding domain-containing protein n=1 Tax=Streptosporangium sp. NPDC000396 TaxID=3366185 RepID=UPI0036B0A106